MEKLTFEEIIEKLKKEFEDDESEFAYCEKHTIEGVGSFEEVDQHGGADEGSHWYSVKYFKEQDMYIKITGYYQSYDGTSFDGWGDCTQVTPQEKTITVYE